MAERKEFENLLVRFFSVLFFGVRFDLKTQATFKIGSTKIDKN